MSPTHYANTQWLFPARSFNLNMQHSVPSLGPSGVSLIKHRVAQPRSQGFSLLNWDPIQKGKALGTRLRVAVTPSAYTAPIETVTETGVLGSLTCDQVLPLSFITSLSLPLPRSFPLEKTPDRRLLGHGSYLWSVPLQLCPSLVNRSYDVM